MFVIYIMFQFANPWQTPNSPWGNNSYILWGAGLPCATLEGVMASTTTQKSLGLCDQQNSLG